MDIRLCLVVLHLLLAAGAEDQFLPSEIVLAANDTPQAASVALSPPADSQPQISTAAAQNTIEATSAQDVAEPSPQSYPEPAMSPPQPCLSCEHCCIEGQCGTLEKCEELGLSNSEILGLPSWLVYVLAGVAAILLISLIAKHCFNKKAHTVEGSLKEKLVKEKIPQTEINVPF